AVEAGLTRLRSLRLVDLIEDLAVGEELLLRIRPALGDRRDREELDRRQRGLELREDRRVGRTVEVLADDLLRLGRVEELEVRLGDLLGALALDVGVDPRERRIGEDADRRIDDLD